MHSFFCFCPRPVSALRCFSCIDCSVGGALSATIQQCEPSENFCATVRTIISTVQKLAPLLESLASGSVACPMQTFPTLVSCRSLIVGPSTCAGINSHTHIRVQNNIFEKVRRGCNFLLVGLPPPFKGTFRSIIKTILLGFHRRYPPARYGHRGWRCQKHSSQYTPNYL